MRHGGDIFEELAADHEAVSLLFSELGGIPLGDPQRKKLVDEVTGDLVRHAVAEEQYLYPLVRRLPDGDRIAEKELADHSSVEALLRELGARSAVSPDFDRLVAVLVREVTGHAHEEEARLFPALAEVVGKDERRALGDRVREAKSRAPERPRRQPPSAVSTEALATLPDPERGLVRRVREFFGHTPPWH